MSIWRKVKSWFRKEPVEPMSEECARLWSPDMNGHSLRKDLTFMGVPVHFDCDMKGREESFALSSHPYGAAEVKRVKVGDEVIDVVIGPRMSAPVGSFVASPEAMEILRKETAR